MPLVVQVPYTHSFADVCETTSALRMRRGSRLSAGSAGAGRRRARAPGTARGGHSDVPGPWIRRFIRVEPGPAGLAGGVARIRGGRLEARRGRGARGPAAVSGGGYGCGLVRLSRWRGAGRPVCPARGHAEVRLSQPDSRCTISASQREPKPFDQDEVLMIASRRVRGHSLASRLCSWQLMLSC